MSADDIRHCTDHPDSVYILNQIGGVHMGEVIRLGEIGILLTLPLALLFIMGMWLFKKRRLTT